MTKKKLRDIVVENENWKWYIQPGAHVDRLVIFSPEKKRYEEYLSIFPMTPQHVKNKILLIKNNTNHVS